VTTAAACAFVGLQRDGSPEEPPFPRLVAGTLGATPGPRGGPAIMAFPTARPPGGSPTLSVLETRVSGHFCPLWVDPPRNPLSTAYSRPWGHSWPKGRSCHHGTPTGCSRSDIGMLSVLGAGSVCPVEDFKPMGSSAHLIETSISDACLVLLCWILGRSLARAIASVSPVPRTPALPEGVRGMTNWCHKRSEKELLHKRTATSRL
jgi:hypothetical protein